LDNKLRVFLVVSGKILSVQDLTSAIKKYQFLFKNIINIYNDGSKGGDQMHAVSTYPHLDAGSDITCNKKGIVTFKITKNSLHILIWEYRRCLFK